MVAAISFSPCDSKQEILVGEGVVGEVIELIAKILAGINYPESHATMRLTGSRPHLRMRS